MTINPGVQDLSIALIRLANEALAADRMVDPEGANEWPAIIARLSAIEAAARDTVLHAITEARDGGESWEKIGQGIGLSRQAAHQRYGARVAQNLTGPAPVGGSGGGQP